LDGAYGFSLAWSAKGVWELAQRVCTICPMVRKVSGLDEPQLAADTLVSDEINLTQERQR